MKELTYDCDKLGLTGWDRRLTSFRAMRGTGNRIKGGNPGTGKNIADHFDQLFLF